MKKSKNLFGKSYPKSPGDTAKRDDLTLPKRKHGSGAPNILVVDGMNIAYQAYYAYSKLSYQGNSTSILYGFVNILKPIIEQYNPYKVVICWDGAKHKERLRRCPEYKSHREKGREPGQRKKFLKQIERVKKLLYYMGIPQAHNANLEGDDILYKVVKKMRVLGHVRIVSGDKDFNQLIDHDTSIYNPRTKYIETIFAFPAANYGLEVNQYVDFLCLVGDSSDDIKGYRGIGPARGSDFLKTYYSVEKYLAHKDEYPGLVDKEALKKLWKRNRILIDLELFDRKFNKNTPLTYYKSKSFPKFREEAFKEYCLKWGMKTHLFPRFLAPFKKLHNA